jgi:hypothetical protein
MEKQNAKFMERKATFLDQKLIKFGVVRSAGDQGDAHAAHAHVYEHDEIAEFDLALDATQPVQNAGGNVIKAVVLNRFGQRYKPGGNGVIKAQGGYSKPISAYYLPFKPGEGHMMQLGNAADYFFTPTLNGCTFACGTGALTPTVSHLNLQNVHGAINQPAMDAMVLTIHGVNTQFVVRRADYKDIAMGAQEDLQAMIVGFRGMLGWKFHMQKFKVDFANAPQRLTLRAVVALN